MDVNCEECAGCCIDWRPVAPEALDHERRGPRRPLDDAYNLAPLTSDEVRAFVEAGYGDAMAPRLWAGDEGDDTVRIDGTDVVSLDDRPVFFVGLRKPPKPTAPFGIEATWLPTCAFLDPSTLQCRIHGDDLYPDTCADYPGGNLRLSQETECERVEIAFGGDRLRDDAPPERLRGLLLGPQALGAKLFAHPEPARLSGVVERAARGELTAADRAEFVGVAVGSHPGSREVDEQRAAAARERALAADSWVGRAAADWQRRAGAPGDGASGVAGASRDVEDDRGAPETPGW